MLWLCGGLFAAGWAFEGRLRGAVCGAAFALALGMVLVWCDADRSSTPRLERPMIRTLTGTVDQAEPLPARDIVRLLVRPDDPRLPPLLRINVNAKDAPMELGPVPA